MRGRLAAMRPGSAQMVARRVSAGAAGAHHRVLDRDAAEADEKLRVPLEYRPGRRPVQELAHRPDDARHDDGLGAVTVAVLAAHVAAETVEEAVELALRVVEAARAAPAVRAAVDARPPVLIVDAPQLPPQQAHGHRPADRHERLSAAALVRARAPVQPAGTDHRLRDPGRLPEAGDDVSAERRGVVVVTVRVA